MKTKEQKIREWRKKRKAERRQFFKANPGSEARFKAIAEQLSPHRGGKL